MSLAILWMQEKVHFGEQNVKVALNVPLSVIVLRNAMITADEYYYESL